MLGHTRWASRRHHLPGQRAPAQLRRDRWRRRSVRDRGAQRRRRQLRRPEGHRGAPHRRRDHDRREGDPDADSRAAGSTARAGEAFRRTVDQLEGSVAIAASAPEPGDLLLALRGSGQALYVGLADDASSSPASPTAWSRRPTRYLRMDGETPPTRTTRRAAARSSSSRGDRAGSLEGIERWAYDGTPLAVTGGELATAEITTRDIDRGDYPHFLLKEITESPASFRKTLRGKLIDADGLARLLGDDASRPRCVADLARGSHPPHPGHRSGHRRRRRPERWPRLDRSLADTPLAGRRPPGHRAVGLRTAADMSDTLVIAISQSGTTTDTNRTVDLVRARGGHVVAIVNRRNSDLTDKSDGVLYTSDGRDVEMSVASTKAFYAQIAAGFLLGGRDRRRGRRRRRPIEASCSPRCVSFPTPWRQPSTAGPRSPSAAQQFAPSVGTGRSSATAQPHRGRGAPHQAVRALLQVDRLRRDRGQEAHRPVVRTADPRVRGRAGRVDRGRRRQGGGDLPGPQGGADRDRHRGRGALRGGPARRSRCPTAHPALAFVLSAMVGHLFGYEAALAIDAQARPLREARAAIERPRPPAAAIGDGEAVLRRGAPAPRSPLSRRFFDGLRAGAYNGHLEASTAVRLASLFRYALGISPLDAYQVEYGKIGTPGVVVDDLTSRPDPRHRGAHPSRRRDQAPGQDRHRRHLAAATSRCCRCRSSTAVLRDRARRATGSATRRCARSPSSTRPSTRSLGSTRYRDRGSRRRSDATVGRDRPWRHRGRSAVADRPRPRAARHQAPGRARARADDVTVGAATAGPCSSCPRPRTTDDRHHAAARPARTTDSGRRRCAAVLQGYRRRFQALTDAVTETEPSVPRGPAGRRRPCVDLLTEPILELADRWRSDRRRVSVGIGVDLVDLDRFRGCSLAARASSTALFTAGSGVVREPRGRDPTERYAVRFAAKEAVMKALGVGLGEFGFHDVEVERAGVGDPSLRAHGRAAGHGAAERGATRWHLSLTPLRPVGHRRRRLARRVEPVLAPSSRPRARWLPSIRSPRRRCGRDRLRRPAVEVLIERPGRRGPCATPAARRHVRAAGGGGGRQGQQRQRRAGRARRLRGRGVRVDGGRRGRAARATPARAIS